MKNLRELRESKGLTLKQVSAPLGRTGEWLRRIEVGSLSASQEVAASIVDCISRYEQIQRKASEVTSLFTGLRIPRPKVWRGLREKRKTHERDV